ncbi:nucleophile aminohydrolase [Spinellus fusiger]|nr:nucleophile aminohydrolase [Spinellus fusiger]
MKNTHLPFISRRSTVYGTHAMVSSSQPLATQAGITILKQGGNAADAAVAVAAALNVTEPGSTGIGGDAFCLYYDAKTRTVRGLNGSGRSPAALTLDYLLQVENISTQTLENDSPHSVTVPGAASAWIDTLTHFGSGNIQLSDVLKPAIDLAENGFPVSELSAYAWKEKEKDLLKFNPGQTMGYLIDGLTPVEGQIVTLTALAETFKTLAEQGYDGFYKGRIAESIVSAVQSRGGLLSLEDLASHTSELVEPISIDYYDWTVWEIPPNGHGITVLIALGIIEALEKSGKVDFSSIDHNSADYIHIIIEVLRIAFADTRHYVTDPEVHSVPVHELLSKGYLAERAKLVNLEHRNDTIHKGYPQMDGNTVYLSVVDEQGNACSFINSIYHSFGSTIVAENTDIVLHNRGCGFVLMKDHPNCIAPSKRPCHTILPSMITRKTEQGHALESCFGVVGAMMQPQGQLQIIMNMLHYKHNPQSALDLPRICISPAKRKEISRHTNDPFIDMNSTIVYIEDGVTKDTLHTLQEKGHLCYSLQGHPRTVFGRGQIIRVHQDQRAGKRVLSAGSDPRGDGQATGW